MSLNYWIEETDYVYVKVPSIPIGTKNIYISKDSGYSPDGDNTFEFYDNFGTSIDTTKWTLTDNGGITWGADYLGISPIGGGGEIKSKNLLDLQDGFVLKKRLNITRVSQSNGYADKYFYCVDELDNSLQYGSQHAYDDPHAHYTKIGDSGVYLTGTEATHTGFATFELKVLPDSLFVKVTGTEESENTRIATTNIKPFLFKLGKGTNTEYGDWQLDWIFVKKAITTEPTITITDKTSYYEIEIDNTLGSALTDYQIQLPATSLGIVSSTDGLNIQEDNQGTNYIEIFTPEDNYTKTPTGTYLTTDKNNRYNTAGQFGTGDHVEVTPLIDMDSWTECSITGWLYLDQDNLSQTIFVSGDNTGTSPYAQTRVLVVSPSTLKLDVRYTGNTNESVDSTFDLNTEQWYHFAAIKDSTGSMKIYLDGELDNTFAGNPGFNTPPTGAKSVIGSAFTSPTFGEDLMGKLGKLEVLNRALTADEVKAKYLENLHNYSNLSDEFSLCYDFNQNLLDNSGNNNNGGYWYSGSLDINFVNDRFNNKYNSINFYGLANQVNTGYKPDTILSFSVVCKPESTITGYTRGIIGNINTYDASGDYAMSLHINSIGEYYLQAKNKYAEGTKAMYVNGELQSTYTYTAAIGEYVHICGYVQLSQPMGKTIIIGRYDHFYTEANKQFLGNIDSVRLWDRQLSDSEFKQLYQLESKGYVHPFSQYREEK